MTAELPYSARKKVQCVEYARRWLRGEMGLVYDDVNIAADIWDKIKFYTRVSDGSRLPVCNVLNGAPQPPNVGDLIIYSEKYLATGHVAVASEVDLQRGLISVCEQNFANQYQGPGHKRRIPLITNADLYWLLDGYLIGWKQIQEATRGGRPRNWGSPRQL